ncbi:MAG TPA: PKD-like domain-containing protein [Mucilaginibacter sp.]|nr:PKD-like domain-containing protein [Mucilaginibacter sp.]
MRSCLFVFVLILSAVSGYSQCTLSVSISASNTNICSGNKVLLTATVTGGTAPFNFTWNTGENTQSINVNKEGTYKVTVTDKTPGCSPVSKTIDISIGTSPPEPTVTGNTLVCPGSSTTLKATGPGGFYQWYDAPTGGNFLASGDTYTTPPINSGLTFYVQATVNGCPSARTGVLVVATGNPTVKDVSTCYGSSAVLTASGGGNYQWYDAASGGNLVGTGASFTTPPLTTTTTYYVVAVINGCISARTAVKANVSAAPQTPVAPGVTICSGTKASLHAVPGQGIYKWYDVPSGGTPLILSPDYTTPVLTATKTYYVENSIDDCVSSRTAVTVTVNAIPPPPGDQAQSTCKGSSILLTASVSPSATYEWYDAPTGGNLLATGTTFQTPILNANTTYYVAATNGGCDSKRSKIDVTVTDPPAAPSVAGAIICNGSAATLTALGPGGTYQWYDAPSGGNLLATGPSFTTPVLTSTTKYYVQTIVSGCASPRKTVTVTVNPVIAPPTTSNTSVCSGSAASLVVTGGGGTGYEWYDSATGGNLLTTGQAYTTPPLTATTTYYVQSTTADGCASTRKALTVTVNQTVTTPSSSDVTVCENAAATLTASAPSGNIEWYDAPSGGNLLKTGTNYTTPALTQNTTYYAQAVVGNCVSGRTPVKVTVNIPADPQFRYPSGSTCVADPNPVPVINNPAGGTFSASPVGLVFVSTATGEINVSASTPGTYTITFAGNGSCVTPSSITYRIYTVTTTFFSYHPSYCQDEPNPLPDYTPGSSGGVFTATPAGLVFVNASTGEIDLKKSKPQTYSITNTIPTTSSCGSGQTTVSVRIDPSVTISAGPDQTVPAGTKVQLAGSVQGVPKGTWSGGTGSFSNTTIPNPVYTPGAGETSATLTYTSDDPPASCGPKSDKMVITFKTTPGAPIVTGNSTCYNSSATLSAIAPGGTYKWYNAANGGTLLFTGASFTTPMLTTNTTYYVEAVNSLGVAGPRATIVVTVNNVPSAPVVATSPVCSGNSITLTPSDLTGNFEWYDAPAGGNLLSKNSTYTTPALTNNQSYYVQRTINGCTSPLTKVDVIVTPLPSVTSDATGEICSGNALNYTITSDVPTATFSWSRAAVTGISNAAVSNQTTTTINETLINTSQNVVTVTYIITPLNNGCTGTPFNYKVMVYPTPAVTSGNKVVICNQSPVNYDITFNTNADFEWSRAAVPGIGNAAISGQTTATIRETLINNTDAPIDVTYVITSNTATCTGTPFNLVVTVNPSVRVISSETGTACSNVPQNYAITSNIASATYVWSRQAVPGISNPTVTNQTSSTIDETLINTLTVATHVVYKIIPTANGCTGKNFFYVVIVNPQPEKPVANSNSPICVGSTVQLRTPNVNNATFMWTGPNGFTSDQQNPDIPNATTANSGDYSLVVTVNGCSSEVSTASVSVRTPGIADAGPDRIICITDPEIILDGNIVGGTSTGIWSTTSNGTFSSLTDLKAHYIPSNEDKANGKVTFTLTSTSDDDCAISTDDVTIFFGPLPAVHAGDDQDVCSQSPSVQLDGSPVLVSTQAMWTTTGTGTFTPSVTEYKANYLPSAADVANGSVNLVLHVTNPGACQIETDTTTIKFIPPPVVKAEKIRYVLKDHTITLNPVVSDANVQYLWTPNVDIDDNTKKNPVITGVIDRTYTVQVTDSRGCVSTDSTMIKVSPKIVIPNTFTPNNDGINDVWNIQGLVAYTDAVVDIFTRYGQKVYHSIGYDRPWDGLFNGKQLPTGVYYYVIDTKLYNQVLSGSITLLR